MYIFPTQLKLIFSFFFKVCEFERVDNVSKYSLIKLLHWNCDKICDKSFTTSSNHAHHEKSFHSTHNLSETNFPIYTVTVLQQPFTCIVAGCGKTAWVKTILESAWKTINPPPQCIMWCYSQWQQSYFDMMKTMAGIEFHQGIPGDTDEPDYLDVSQHNLIVLDDLMVQSGKDQRIADLFAKGSHHRNCL